MQNMRGKFIVIDGADATGKGTQVALLQERLEQKGYSVKVVDFPQYGKPSAWFAERYLNGDFGSAEAVGPFQASVFFAVDRYASKSEIEYWLEGGGIILSNRYVAANLGHQGSKIDNIENRKKLWDWILNFEHEIMGIPRPDKNFILYLPPEVAFEAVETKGERAYLTAGKKRDVHEQDPGHFRKTTEAFLELASTFPEEFEVIDTTKDGTRLTPRETLEVLWARIEPLIKKEG